MYSNPDLCVIDRTPHPKDRFHAHKLGGALVGFHSLRVLPYDLDIMSMCGGFRIVYKCFHAGNKYTGLSSLLSEDKSFANTLTSYLDMYGFQKFTDFPFIFFIRDACVNYHNVKITDDIGILLNSEEFKSDKSYAAISEVRDMISWW